ncbi:MAG: hypothetical protein ACRD0X_03260 [Thermoanaerobaculia bacterium]
MPPLSLPPRSLRVAAAVAAALVLAANPVAEALRLKYWAEGWGPRKLHTLQTSGLAPEVLILGSSRMDAALIAGRIERSVGRALRRPIVAYNAAQAASGASEPIWVLSDVVASNGCPDVVVVDVHVEGLSVESERLLASLAVYAPLTDFPRVLPHILLDPERLDAFLGIPFRGFANLARALVESPRSRRAEKLARVFVGRRGSRYWPSGSSPSAAPEESLASRSRRDREREARGRRRFLIDEHHLDRFALGGLPAANLERLADRAAACGAGLVLVELPTRYRMREWGFGEAEAAARAFVAAFAARRGATHLDLARTLEPLADEDFFDLSHLSFRGAVKASDAVVPAIVEALRSVAERQPNA